MLLQCSLLGLALHLMSQQRFSSNNLLPYHLWNCAGGESLHGHRWHFCDCIPLMGSILHIHRQKHDSAPYYLMGSLCVMSAQRLQSSDINLIYLKGLRNECWIAKVGNLRNLGGKSVCVKINIFKKQNMAGNTDTMNYCIIANKIVVIITIS